MTIDGIPSLPHYLPLHNELVDITNVPKVFLELKDTKNHVNILLVIMPVNFDIEIRNYLDHQFK